MCSSDLDEEKQIRQLLVEFADIFNDGSRPLPITNLLHARSDTVDTEDVAPDSIPMRHNSGCLAMRSQLGIRPRIGVRNALQGQGLGPQIAFCRFRSQGSTPGTRLGRLPERVPTPVPIAQAECIKLGE